MGSMNRKQALLCALAFIIPALVGFFVWSDDGKRSGEDSVVAEITESGNANEESRVLVYVVGAVKEPGVYELQRGAACMTRCRLPETFFLMRIWKASIWQNPLKML